jgi:hypothetical protein
MRTNGAARAQIPSEQAVLPDDAPPDTSPQVTVERIDFPQITERQAEDLAVPFEAQFGGKDYLPAPGLRRVALGLIMRDQALRHLTDIHVEYLWKRRGGTRRGVGNIGDCVMPSGLSKHAWNQMAIARSGSTAEHVVFIVWLAADHLEQFTTLQVEASLYRQLLKTTTDPRDHSAFKLRAPDFVGFVKEIERYGLWSQSLVQAAPAFNRAAYVDQNAQGEMFTEPSEANAPEPAVEGDF